MEIRGARPRVILLCPPDDLLGDARLNFEILSHTNVRIADLSAAAAESGAKIMEAGNTLTALGMDRIGQRVRESIVPRWLSKSRLITPEGLRPLVSGARKRLEQARLDVPQMDAGDL